MAGAASRTHTTDHARSGLRIVAASLLRRRLPACPPLRREPPLDHAWPPASTGTPPASHVRKQPVADIVDAELAMIDLAVFGAAFLRGEDLDVLSLRADGLVQLLRFRKRDDPLVLAMQHQERALDLLCDPLEREFLRPFERGLVVGRAHHPAELEQRGGAGARVDREPGFVAGYPFMDAPVHGAERDGGGVALLECDNARRVIAAEAVAHDRDTPGIDIGAGCDVVVRRRPRHFV